MEGKCLAQCLLHETALTMMDPLKMNACCGDERPAEQHYERIRCKCKVHYNTMYGTILFRNVCFISQDASLRLRIHPMLV